MKRYVINLDLPEKERWKFMLEDNKDKLLRVRQEIEKITCPFSSMLSMAESFLTKTKVLYRGEIQSVAEATGLSFAKVLAMQLLYELSACCTSVVYEKEGRKVMFRSMDWEMDFLRDITVEVEFTKEGKKLFLATTWVGYVGILTALKYHEQGGSYAVAVNYRRSKQGNLAANFASLARMEWPIGYLVRAMCESSSSAKKARYLFSTLPLVSPTFVTICHKEESCILVRDAKGLVKEVGWSNFPLIQTNLDPEENEPNILYSRERREACKERIRRGEKLERYPIINFATVYSCRISPEENSYATTVNKV